MSEKSSKKISRRDFVRMAGVTTVGLVATACVTVQQPAAEQVEVVVTATPPPEAAVEIIATTQMPIDTFDDTVERSKSQLTNVDLTVTQTQIADIGWSGYSDLILTQIAGGEQLDVIMIAVEGIGLLGAKNVLRPLDEFFSADPPAQEVLDTEVHPLLLEMLQFEDKQLEYPFSWNNMLMYYNTAIFEEEGIDPPAEDWTWNDFLTVAQEVARVTGGSDDRFAYSFWGAGMFGMHAWLFTNDTSAFTEGWVDSNLNDPKVAETVQFLADLILEHKVAPNPSGWDEWAQFHAGNLVMRTCGRWCIGGSIEADFETYDLQFQPFQSGSVRTVAGTDGWGIASVSQNPDKAWEAVKILSDVDSSLAMVRLGGNIPALRSVAEMPEFAEFGPPRTDLFYGSLDFAKTVPSPPNFNIVEPIMNRHLSTIWNGERAVEEALADAHNEIQAEMDKIK